MAIVTRGQEEEMVALVAKGGYSQNEIAAAVGVSRGTVQNHMQGRRRLRWKHRRQKPEYDFRNAEFCTVCRRWAPYPCPACLAENETSRILRNECSASELEFDFDEEMRERYEKVKKEKLDEIRRSSPYYRGPYTETGEMSTSCEESH